MLLSYETSNVPFYWDRMLRISIPSKIANGLWHAFSVHEGNLKTLALISIHYRWRMGCIRHPFVCVLPKASVRYNNSPFSTQFYQPKSSSCNNGWEEGEYPDLLLMIRIEAHSIHSFVMEVKTSFYENGHDSCYISFFATGQPILELEYPSSLVVHHQAPLHFSSCSPNSSPQLTSSNTAGVVLTQQQPWCVSPVSSWL